MSPGHWAAGNSRDPQGCTSLPPRRSLPVPRPGPRYLPKPQGSGNGVAPVGNSPVYGRHRPRARTRRFAGRGVPGDTAEPKPGTAPNPAAPPGHPLPGRSREPARLGRTRSVPRP